MAAELDKMVKDFRARPLDAGPYTFLWIDALTQKVREGNRTVNVYALIAGAVNADGTREILGHRRRHRGRTARAGWRSCGLGRP